ncbi:MAG: ATP-dependent RecD-like DNA helicase [Polyangiaceae bacterium]|nr:ATP-dependent RecD-like DNA helicase [Polyangiaceae bacterium]
MTSSAGCVATTLTAEVERVTFENEETGFRVLRVATVDGLSGHQGPLVVVGNFAPVGPGTRVRITGQLVRDPRHGEQFRADVLVPLAPDTLDGIEKYLGSGIISGIGPGFAKRIVGRFGLDTLTVLDRDPGRLAEVPGIGQRRVEEVRRVWGTHRAMTEVMLLLQTHGASPSLASRIFATYGDRAASVVQQSPYRLAIDVRGVGFKTADRLARSLGIRGDHPDRAQAGVLHLLEERADAGHVHEDRPSLAEQAATLLAIEFAHTDAAIGALWGQGRVVIEEGRVFLTRLHRAEAELARGLVRALSATEVAELPHAAAIAAFEAEAGVELAPRQREAIAAAARHPVVVITGGPGVGKTTIVRAILRMFGRARLSVALAAPTGRAAKRLAEATGADASTLHRLLEVDAKTLRFQRDAACPLEVRAVIVDEFSMVDVGLAAALVAALPNGARLIAVGDADQLPSVGPGAVLRDLVASGVVPTVRLDHVFRQARESGIIANAHRIHDGIAPEGAEGPLGDFFVISRRDPAKAAQTVREIVTERIPKTFGFDRYGEVQVLTPMHRGPVGTHALNAMLQSALNPEGPSLSAHGEILRVGDKVMQTRNDYEREVFNGDIGRVVAVDVEARTLIASFDGRSVAYEDTDLDALVLAYATTIHKSQGSEYPAVVIPLLTTHFVMLSRNLLYTAVTRARRLCVLIADPRAVSLALAETRREVRATHLSARLRTNP